MKLSDARVVELRHAAQTLMLQIQVATEKAQDQPVWGPRNPDEFYGFKKRMRLHGALGGKFSPKLTPELEAVCSALRCLLSAEDYREHDLQSVVGCLNLPIDSLEGGMANHDTSQPRYLFAHGPLLRFIADDLVRYSHLMARMDDLWEQNPITVCPYCDGLFLKTKSNQEFCSTRCRVACWGKTKGKAYFAKKQREFRRNAKEARKRKQRAVVKSVRESVDAVNGAAKSTGAHSARPRITPTQGAPPKST